MAHTSYVIALVILLICAKKQKGSSEMLMVDLLLVKLLKQLYQTAPKNLEAQ